MKRGLKGDALRAIKRLMAKEPKIVPKLDRPAVPPLTPKATPYPIPTVPQTVIPKMTRPPKPKTKN